MNLYRFTDPKDVSSCDYLAVGRTHYDAQEAVLRLIKAKVEEHRRCIPNHSSHARVVEDLMVDHDSIRDSEWIHELVPGGAHAEYVFPEFSPQPMSLSKCPKCNGLTTPKMVGGPRCQCPKPGDHVAYLREIANIFRNEYPAMMGGLDAAAAELTKAQAALEAATRENEALVQANKVYEAAEPKLRHELFAEREMNRRLREALVPASKATLEHSGLPTTAAVIAQEALALTTPPAATDRMWVEVTPETLRMTGPLCVWLCEGQSEHLRGIVEGYYDEGRFFYYDDPELPVEGVTHWMLRESPPAPPTPEPAATKEGGKEL